MRQRAHTQATINIFICMTRPLQNAVIQFANQIPNGVTHCDALLAPRRSGWLAALCRQRHTISMVSHATPNTADRRQSKTIPRRHFHFLFTASFYEPTLKLYAINLDIFAITSKTPNRKLTCALCSPNGQ